MSNIWKYFWYKKDDIDQKDILQCLVVAAAIRELFRSWEVKRRRRKNLHCHPLPQYRVALMTMITILILWLAVDGWKFSFELWPERGLFVVLREFCCEYIGWDSNCVELSSFKNIWVVFWFCVCVCNYATDVLSGQSTWLAPQHQKSYKIRQSERTCQICHRLMWADRYISLNIKARKSILAWSW